MKTLLAQLFFVLAGVLAVAALWRSSRLFGLVGRQTGLAGEQRDGRAGPGGEDDGAAAELLHDPTQPRDAELVRLHDERRRLLAHLREIQFDFDTGKIDSKDHAELKAKYEQEALAVLRALDAHPRPQEQRRG